MGYGEGRSQLYADIEKERAQEESLFRRQKATAQAGFEDEAESEGILSFIGGGIGAAWGFFSGGGVPGAVEGWQVGSEGGKWLHNWFSNFDPEDFYVSTDVGKFDVMQKWDLEEFNRALSSAHKAEFWQDVTDTGANLLSMYYRGQGKETAGGIKGVNQFFDDIDFDFDPWDDIPEVPTDTGGILS